MTANETKEGKDRMCEVCRGWEARGFERPPCAAGACAYRHLGWADPVEREAAGVRNAIRARGIGER